LYLNFHGVVSSLEETSCEGWQYGCNLSKKNKQKHGNKFRMGPEKREDVKETRSKVTGNGEKILKASRKQNIDLEHLTTLL
jgi:hypothetical protein